MTVQFNQLKKNLKREIDTSFTPIAISILGDSPTQLLNTAIKGYGIERGVNYDVYDADIDQIDMHFFDSSSAIYQRQNNYVILFESVFNVRNKFYKANPIDFADKYIAKVQEYYQQLSKNSNHKLLILNFPELNDYVFGNFSNKTKSSFIYQIKKINLALIELAAELPNLFIIDVNSLYGQVGEDIAFIRNMYISSGLVYNLDFTALIAKHITDVVLAVQGKIKKCVIIDLDNTMWGGIIGDDGIENIQLGELGIGKSFTELQKWLLQLKQRGIILCVCSKNNEDVAKLPFVEHPDMQIKLEDIAVFVANWETKVDNIKHIQKVLNIGFDSMVFLDDNAFERNMVKEAIEDVTVPELPEDPALYLSYIQSLNLFETATFVESDKDRTAQYQEEAKRVSFMKTFTNEKDFLANLKMTSTVAAFNSYNIPRIAQLSQRSNQFNLTTIRYTEEDMLKCSLDNNYITLSFTLNDNFGDHGLIAVLVLKLVGQALHIESWFMSCRVLKRTMENFMINKIISVAKERNATSIVGTYIPTAKNKMVEQHYPDLGFTTDPDDKFLYKLDPSTYIVKETFITESINK